jgi:hypothetical protein
VKSSNQGIVKRLGAVLGGGALLVMAALGVALHQAQSGPDAIAKSANVNFAATSTVTTPPPVPAITMAVPALKGPAPLPPEEQGLP